MNTPNRIINPQALLSMYEEFPSLNGSEIMEILFKRDEPRVSMKIMTSNKPEKTPARWPQGFDVVYLGISFIGVKKITQSGWGHTNTVDQFNIENPNDSVSVRISCKNDFSFSFDCDWISVDSLAPGSVGTP
ncbi:immunity 50 family protein [Variovorax paradoxus]|uniref:immunity 50 family protein n=1 Tax=Variovorax paradoxus TaxID=34073 RepID=UPI003ECD9F66